MAKEELEDIPSAHLLKAVGGRLKEARLKAGLTQVQLSNKAGVPSSYIFELETGRQNITLRTIAKMSHVLGVEPRDLLPEKSSEAASIDSLQIALSVFDRLAESEKEWLTQDKRREVQQADFLHQIRSFTDLRGLIERGLAAVAAQQPKQAAAAKPAKPSGSVKKKPRSSP